MRRRRPRPITRPITVAVLIPDGEGVVFSWEMAVVVVAGEVDEIDDVVEGFEVEADIDVDVDVDDSIDEELEETGALTLNPLE